MTFGQKIPKLNSRPVYSKVYFSRLYDMHVNVTTNFIQDEDDVFGSKIKWEATTGIFRG